jgi:uncharacterized linocin/CFP29 family protein
MNHLLRDFAPLSEAAWAAIEDEARSRLTTYLAARKLVDFEGPHGWTHSATNLGHVASIEAPAEGIDALQRQVLPLVELRLPFVVSRATIDDAGRGATRLDLDELEEAVRTVGRAENALVFHGYPAAGIVGITEASSHDPIPLDADLDTYPTSVAKAVNVLRVSGIDGPYGLAIGPTGFTAIIETTEHGGLLLLDHLRQILGGPVVWAPGVEGAVVLSLRGGDFVLDSGQDLSIGYLAHDAERVQLYLEESISFRVVEPDAAVALVG